MKSEIAHNMDYSLKLTDFIEKISTNKDFISTLPELAELVPERVDPSSDIWNCIDWEKRKLENVMNIRFVGIKNLELKRLLQAWILDLRKNSNISAKSARAYVEGVKHLDVIIHNRRIKTIKTSDFNNTEKFLKKNYSHGTAHRSCIHLKGFGNFLNRVIGTRIDYHVKMKSTYKHGRQASDEDKISKLLPDSILIDLLLSKNRPDLSRKDKFFIAVFSIITATGFRINELTTLPKKCIHSSTDKEIQILNYPEKGGEICPRPIPPELSEMVIDAHKLIVEMTEAGRESARNLSQESVVNWNKVFRNKKATEYFVKKFCHAWTSDPDNNMMNPDGAWYEAGQKCVNILSDLEKYDGNKSKLARESGINRETIYKLERTQKAIIAGDYKLANYTRTNGEERVNWDTDKRTISIHNFYKSTGNYQACKKGSAFIKIFEDALHLQLQGKVYPNPEFDEFFEKEFNRNVEALLYDENNNPVLYFYDSLFVIPKYFLSDHRATDFNDFSHIKDRQICSWLTGEKRSQGTKNHEDSVFSRLDIINPRTGKPAQMTVHDIRHWLNTIYENGGLTDAQIALIFNRKYKDQNSVYDQTTNSQRRARMKAAIKGNKTLGTVSDTYIRLAEYNKNEAEEYLESITKMINPMPHGVCLLSWASTPCPHHLSCFDCNNDTSSLCPHLVIDKEDEAQISEIQKISKQSELLITAFEFQGFNDSRQLEHSKRVKINTDTILMGVKTNHD